MGSEQRLEAALTLTQFNKIKRSVSFHARKYIVPQHRRDEFQDDLLSETLARLTRSWDPEKGAAPATLAEVIIPQVAERLLYQSKRTGVACYWEPTVPSENTTMLYESFGCDYVWPTSTPQPEEGLYEELCGLLTPTQEETFRAYFDHEGGQATGEEAAATLGVSRVSAGAKLQQVRQRLRKTYERV